MCACLVFVFIILLEYVLVLRSVWQESLEMSNISQSFQGDKFSFPSESFLVLYKS